MSNTGKSICTPINKEAILKRFNAKSKANLNILQLIEALPEVFSREPLNPECFTQGYRVPPAEELFATAISTNRQQNFVSKPKTVSKSPFSNSGLVENHEAKVWYYIDEAGSSQGPFTTLQMDEWYDHKYFENDLQIRRAGQDNFSKLIDALTKSENRPFQKQGGQFERGQYNKPQYRSGNENTWDRGKNFNRNNQTENKASSGMPITRNVSDTKATSDKTSETQEQLSIARNQSENKAKTETEPLNLEVQKQPEVQVQKQPETIQKPVADVVVEKPAAVVEVKQPEVKIQETVKPAEPEKIEEPPKQEEEQQQEQEAPVEEEKKEPEQKATLTQNPRIPGVFNDSHSITIGEFISDEWKVTIKKKKGKKGKFDEEPEEPVRPTPVTQPKREEPEAKSPTKASQNVVSEPQQQQQQPKKKIISGWGGEEPKKAKQAAANPEEEFPSLESTVPVKTAVVTKKTAPVEEKKRQAVVQQPKEDFPGLSSNNSKAKPAPAQEKPKAVVPESKPKKQIAPEIQEDFPTIESKSDFPSLGQTQPKAKPLPKTQPKPSAELPKKSTNKPTTSAPKENLSENPKYLNDFPTL